VYQVGFLLHDAEAYFTVSVATPSDKFGRCVKPPFLSWIFHTWNLLLEDLMWSNGLWI